jgi:hypothetical protein
VVKLNGKTAGNEVLVQPGSAPGNLILAAR